MDWKNGRFLYMRCHINGALLAKTRCIGHPEQEVTDMAGRETCKLLAQLRRERGMTRREAVPLLFPGWAL